MWGVEMMGVILFSFKIYLLMSFIKSFLMYLAYLEFFMMMIFSFMQMKLNFDLSFSVLILLIAACGAAIGLCMLICSSRLQVNQNSSNKSLVVCGY